MYRRSLYGSKPAPGPYFFAVIAALWLIGLLLGVAAGCCYGETLEAVFFRTPDQLPALRSLLCGNVLPLWICAYAFSFFPGLVGLLCMSRAVCTGLGLFAGAQLTRAIGWAGVLPLFSCLLCGMVQLWYCERRTCRSAVWDFPAAFGLELGIILADWALIGPLLCQIQTL